MAQPTLTKDKIPQSGSLDYSGIIVSILCLIHCLGTPLLLLLAPTLIGLEAGHSVLHGVLLILIIPLALFSFWRCFNLHKSYGPAIIGSLGVGLLIVALVIADLFLLHDVERPITVAGSLFLITGHVLNIRKCKDHKHINCRHD